MVTEVKCLAVFGVETKLVKVEVDVSPGLPSFEMIGLLGTDVKEAKNRVKVALTNCGINMAPMRITVNLSPADMRKDGTLFDLAIAAGLLASYGIVSTEKFDNSVFVGEIGLNGEIKGVNGVLSIALWAKDNGIERLFVSSQDVNEALLVEGINVIGVNDLSSLITVLSLSENDINNYYVKCENDFTNSIIDKLPDYLEVCGQESAKRAILIAVSGFHNLLMIGPPGTGKSMLAKRITSIMPELTKEESLEVTKISSLCGLINKEKPLVKIRPFISPHHSASIGAMAGGGRLPSPGLVTRAHKGVLFLDEIVHFSSASLEILRQPLEDKSINVSRINYNQNFPADFMLVGAMNPCPCGNYPDYNLCTCTPEKIRNYVSKISGPVLDRIDICTEVNKNDILVKNNKEQISSSDMKEIVLKAFDLQKERFIGTDIKFNGGIGPGEIDKYIHLNKSESELMKDIYKKMNLSYRGYHRILKVARTIADIRGDKDISKEDLLEAVYYRSIEEKYFI